MGNFFHTVKKDTGRLECRLVSDLIDMWPILHKKWIVPLKHTKCFYYSMLNSLVYVLTDLAVSHIPKKLSDTIASELPDLPDQVVKSIEETLKAFGAATTDDLRHVTEGDLLPVLKPIQARRLVAAGAQNSECKTLPPQHSTLVL